MEFVHGFFRRMPAVMKVVQIICQTAELKIPFVFDNIGANTFTAEENAHMLGVVRSRFGPGVYEKDLHVIGCGTIGRVYRYKDFALKVKIPGVLERIKRDLGWIERVASLLDMITMHHFYFHRKVRIVHDSICRQNDFAHELQNGMEYTDEMRRHGIDPNCIFVPKFYPDLSSEDMITMSFVPGQTVASIQNPSKCIPAHVRNELHKYVIFNLALFRFCHADLHVGNLILEEHSKRLAVIDFGMCMKRLPRKKIIVILKLMQAAQQNDAIAIARLIAMEYFWNNDPSKCIIDMPEYYNDLEYEIVRSMHNSFHLSELHKIRDVFRRAADWSLPKNVWGSREMGDVEVAAMVSLTNLLIVGIDRDLVQKYSKIVMEIEGVD